MRRMSQVKQMDAWGDVFRISLSCTTQHKSPPTKLLCAPSCSNQNLSVHYDTQKSEQRATPPVVMIPYHWLILDALPETVKDTASVKLFSGLDQA